MVCKGVSSAPITLESNPENTAHCYVKLCDIYCTLLSSKSRSLIQQTRAQQKGLKVCINVLQL